MKTIKFLILTLLIFGFNNLHATTWKEPWTDQVIKESSSFVLAKVIATDPEKEITIQIIKTLGGVELKDTIIISDFYLLTLCSTSGGHGPKFITSVDEKYYFFIKKNAEGKYCIATPTAGFDHVTDNEVTATYRHSYHQAAVPIDIYEKTMTAIFNNYHNLPYDEKFINSFVIENLSKKPAGFSEEEIKTFFLQHAALECVYHLKLKINESLILPFLNDTANFHSQVSGARAMVVVNTKESKQELLKIIRDKDRRDFVKVMCVWTIEKINAKELKSQLKEIEKTASEEEDGFGGNIMDPRVCTSLPTVKEALAKCIEEI